MGLLDVIKKWFQPRHGMQAWVEIGQEALSRGELEEAEAAFLKASEVTPNAESVAVGLIQIALLRDHVSRAFNLYEQMSERQQRQHHDLLMLALSLQSESITPRAYALWMRLPSAGPDRLKGLRELCQRHPKCGFLAAQWAELALQSFQLDEADVALRLLRDADPSLPERQVALLYARRDVAQIKEHADVGRVLEEASQVDDPHVRLRRLEPMASEHMHIAPLQHDTGLAFFQAGRPEVAIRYLHRAVGNNPYWVNAWVHLGAAAFAARRIVRARGAFSRVLRLQHHDWIAALFQRIETELSSHPELPLLEKALDRMEAGDPSGAILPLRQALAIRPDAPPLLRALGEALFAKRDFREALPIFADLLKQSNGAETSGANAEIHHKVSLCAHRLAMSLIAKQAYKDAEEQLTSLLLIDQDLSVVEDDLRLLRQVQSGEVSEEAFQLYEKAQPSAGLSLDEQIAALSEALESSPRFTDAMLVRAILRAEKGDLESAQEEIARALTVEQESWRLRFHQAGLAFLLQDSSAARLAWQACAASGKLPWSGFAASNLRALSSGTTARLLIVAMPEHHRVIEFSPVTGETEVPSEILADNARLSLLPVAPLAAETKGAALSTSLLPQKQPREAFADALADAFADAHLLDLPPSAPSSSSMEMVAVDPAALQALHETSPQQTSTETLASEAPVEQTTSSAPALKQAPPQDTPSPTVHAEKTNDLFPDAHSAGALKVLSPEDAVRRNQSLLEKTAQELEEPSDFFAKTDEKDLFADETYPLTAESSVLIASIEPTSFITPSFFDLPSFQHNPPKETAESVGKSELFSAPPKGESEQPLFHIPADASALPLALPPQAQKEWSAGTSIDINDKEALWATYQALSKEKVPRLSVVLSRPDKPLSDADPEESIHRQEAHDALTQTKDDAPTPPVFDVQAKDDAPAPPPIFDVQAKGDAPKTASSEAESTVATVKPIKAEPTKAEPTKAASTVATVEPFVAKTPAPASLDDLFGELDVPASAIHATPKNKPLSPAAPSAKADISTEKPISVAASLPTQGADHDLPAKQSANESFPVKATGDADPWGGSGLLDSLGSNKMSFHETFPSNDELLSFLDDAIDGLQEKKSDKNQ